MVSGSAPRLIRQREGWEGELARQGGRRHGRLGGHRRRHGAAVRGQGRLGGHRRPKDKEGEALAAELKAAGKNALYVRTDVASEADVKALAEATMKAFGRVDVLVNNAGIMKRHERVEDWPTAEVRQIIDVNLVAIFLTTHAFVPLLERDGGGAIINISSVGSLEPVPYSPAYAATKGGVLALTRSFAPTLGPRGVRVNAILPNFVDTPMTADSPGRGVFDMLQPIDLATGIVHVAGDEQAQGGFYVVHLVDGKRTLSKLQDPPPMTEVAGVF
jgi:NAD(P)-dependent dehydrogenase (short-subunit alcohol dehydrogenase family)